MTPTGIYMSMMAGQAAEGLSLGWLLLFVFVLLLMFLLADWFLD